MINTKFLKSLNYFKEITLKRWDILFDEWEINNNLYYILSGKLSIEKYTTKEKKETKQLAIIWKDDFLWEWSLNTSEPKQVKVLASEKSVLLYIDAKTDFLDFMKEYPEEAKNILVYIISITNKRTLVWNKYITSIYEINKSIREIKKVNFKEIFKILDKINLILEWEFLIFLETNRIDKSYLTLKYDSRKSWKMQDKLLEKWKYNLEEIWIKKDYKILTKEIFIWEESLWNIVITKKESFNQNDKRIFLGMINSLAWILKQKKFLEEERDKEFSRV